MGLCAAAPTGRARAQKFIRFGGNMRQVAMTEGDKVPIEIKLGFAVNTYSVGGLVENLILTLLCSASDYKKTYLTYL